MFQALIDALPILLLIVVGVVVRAVGLVDRDDGLALLRLVYYVTIPSAVFVSISQSAFTADRFLSLSLASACRLFLQV